MKKQNFLVMIVLLNVCLISQAAELDAKLNWSGYQKYGFAVNGVVEEVNVDIGKKVKQGEVLAKLSASPFNYNIKKCQAALNQFDPSIFDAKLELDQAEELFERTVLSEVELQKIDGRYKILIEQQNEAKAECLLQRWQSKLSVLKAKEPAYVLNSNIVTGTVISDENKSAVFIELVSAKQASAVAWLSHKEKLKFNIGNDLKVIVDQQELPAKVKSIALQADAENRYKLVAEFYYTNVVEPGKSIKIKY